MLLLEPEHRARLVEVAAVVSSAACRSARGSRARSQARDPGRSRALRRRVPARASRSFDPRRRPVAFAPMTGGSARRSRARRGSTDTPSSAARSTRMFHGTLQSPIARNSVWRRRSSVISPAGFVKLTRTAPGASRATIRAISSITGIVRSAFAKPPTPVVSCPIRPNSRPSSSSRWRAACPPTRSWQTTKSASRIGVGRARPSSARRRRIRPPRPCAPRSARRSRAARGPDRAARARRPGARRAAGAGRRRARACRSSPADHADLEVLHASPSRP